MGCSLMGPYHSLGVYHIHSIAKVPFDYRKYACCCDSAAVAVAAVAVAVDDIANVLTVGFCVAAVAIAVFVLHHWSEVVFCNAIGFHVQICHAAFFQL